MPAALKNLLLAVTLAAALPGHAAGGASSGVAEGVSSEEEALACARGAESLRTRDRGLQRESHDLRGESARLDKNDSVIAQLRAQRSRELRAEIEKQNVAVETYNARRDKLVQSLDELKSDFAAYNTRCDSLRITSTVRTRVCIGGDYPTFCASAR